MKNLLLFFTFPCFLFSLLSYADETDPNVDSVLGEQIRTVINDLREEQVQLLRHNQRPLTYESIFAAPQDIGHLRSILLDEEGRYILNLSLHETGPDFIELQLAVYLSEVGAGHLLTARNFRLNSGDSAFVLENRLTQLSNHIVNDIQAQRGEQINVSRLMSKLLEQSGVPLALADSESQARRFACHLIAKLTRLMVYGSSFFLFWAYEVAMDIGTPQWRSHYIRPIRRVVFATLFYTVLALDYQFLIRNECQ